MLINKDEISKIAELYLDELIINNSYSNLGLPKRIDQLLKDEWAINFIKKSDFYTIPVYAAEINFFHEDTTVATYKLYLSDELEFVDSFL